MNEVEINQNLLHAVKQASARWKTAFNHGDANGCALQYEVNAVMNAKPFGTYTGTDEIKAFWKKLIDDGFTDVEYINPNFEVMDESSGVLTSEWRMNKASGVITRELWVMQSDGVAKLREDNFEAKG